MNASTSADFVPLGTQTLSNRARSDRFNAVNNRLRLARAEHLTIGELAGVLAGFRLGPIQIWNMSDDAIEALEDLADRVGM